MHPSDNTCPTCGEPRVYGDDETHRTVERIVRSRQRYGDASAGSRVLVEARHADHPSVTAATMSLDEAQAARDAAAEAQAAKATKGGALKSMVERGIVAARAEVEATIARGRHRDAVLRARALEADPAVPASRVAVTA